MQADFGFNPDSDIFVPMSSVPTSMPMESEPVAIQRIGETLYPRIARYHPCHVGQIIVHVLQTDLEKLNLIVMSDSLLIAKIHQAMQELGL